MDSPGPMARTTASAREGTYSWIDAATAAATAAAEGAAATDEVEVEVEVEAAGWAMSAEKADCAGAVDAAGAAGVTEAEGAAYWSPTRASMDFRRSSAVSSAVTLKRRCR